MPQNNQLFNEQSKICTASLMSAKYKLRSLTFKVIISSQNKTKKSMETSTNKSYSEKMRQELQFIERLLSFSSSNQREISDYPIMPQVEFNINNPSQVQENLQECHFNDKIIETEHNLKQQCLLQNLSQQTLKLSSLENEHQKSRIKDEIKTYPNFIVRSFVNYIHKYKHVYSRKDGFSNLLNYLEQLFGAKHYTLKHLQDLFQDNPLWNCRINRAVLHHMLGKHSYSDIFNNGQRKKKKTYLIMTKVYKLRVRHAKLSLRVQCQ